MLSNNRAIDLGYDVRQQASINVKVDFSATMDLRPDNDNLNAAMQPINKIKIRTYSEGVAPWYNHL